MSIKIIFELQWWAVCLRKVHNKLNLIHWDCWWSQDHWRKYYSQNFQCQDSCKKVKQTLPTPLSKKGYQVILFQTVITFALFSVLFFLSQVKQRKVKRKEIENKEIETKHKIKINFSKKDFYKICVFILALRLAPKNVFLVTI